MIELLLRLYRRQKRHEIALPVAHDKCGMVDEKYRIRETYTAQDSLAGCAWNERDEDSRL